MHRVMKVKTAAEGEFAVCLAESNKREMFRDDGATSPESWTAEMLRYVWGDSSGVRPRGREVP